MSAKFFRVKMNSKGLLPIGWPIGMMTCFFPGEMKALDLNPQLRECLEEIDINSAEVKQNEHEPKDRDDKI